MTTPTPDSFDYTDDSVVARVSFDIPSSALGDVTQLTSAMGAMRTELEAIARAQSDWLDYLQQIPAITEQANQAIRQQITLMERMSYLQGEVGVGRGGGVFSGGGIGGGGGGGYSTAAPPNFVDNFRGMLQGTGAHGGDGGAGGVGGIVSAMQSNDPHTFANVNSARGEAVNPSMLGALGGAAAVVLGKGTQPGAQGTGVTAPGSTSPQGTQAARTSAGAPDPAQSGAPTGSAPTTDPGEPSPDAPESQKLTTSLINEFRMGKLGAKLGSIFGGGGQGGGGGGGGGRGGGGLSGMIANVGSGMIGGIFGNKAGGMVGNMLQDHPSLGYLGAAGLGLGAVGAAQNIGERITGLTQLGSVQGGGAIEGAGYEIESRIMALNPFITTDQARQVMQMSLKSGFRGGEGDTVQDFMVKNFKDMSMSFADSLELINSSVVKGGESSKSFSENMTNLQDSLDLMKGLSDEGGAALPTRQEQFKETVSTLTSMNVGRDSAQRAALGLQEAFKDNRVLREAAPGIANSASQNPLFLTQVAQRNGITGMLPGAIPGALEDAGIDFDEAFLDQARYVANMVKNYPGGIRNQAAMFQQLMAEQGAPMDGKQAYEMYKELIGGRDIEGDIVKSMGEGFGARSIGSRIMSPLKAVAQATGLTAIDNIFKGDFKGAMREVTEAPLTLASTFGGDVEARREASEFAASRADGGFSRQGRTAPPLPQNAAQVAGGSLTAQGQVTGEVRITVDQQGRVTAPPTIQLTGQQKAALAGYGSTQLNNAPPGDPTYMHAHNAFPGGGSG